MADNIIDGIEYETEPHPDYLIDGKPVYYAKNVPDLLRGELRLSRAELTECTNLNRRDLVDRLSSGAAKWNLWVQWAQLVNKRWLQFSEDGSKTYVRLKREGDDKYKSAALNFAEAYGDSRYPIRVADFSQCVFPAAVSFMKADFQCDVDLSGRQFADMVSFSNAKFTTRSNFSNCKFEGGGIFNNTNFSNGANFGNAKFHKFCQLKSAEFREEADFTSMRSECHAQFDGAQFHGPAYLHEAIFIQQANFSKVRASDLIAFGGAQFCGDAWFEKAEFGGGVAFDLMHFKSSAHFEAATFRGSNLFSVASFAGAAHFENITLAEGVFRINNVEFAKSTSFEGAVFDGKFICSNSAFTGETTFAESKFKQSFQCSKSVFFARASWGDVSFAGTANFQGCYFLSSSFFAGASFENYVNFDFAHFGKDKNTKLPKQYKRWGKSLQQKYDQSDVRSRSMTISGFKGAKFQIVPEFGLTEVAVPPPPKWRLGSQILRWVGLRRYPRVIGDKHAASKLRRLGEYAAARHHHLAEKRFFRAELLCRRGWETDGWREVAMINAFEAFSKCGLSFWRPIFWWAIVYAIFFAVYGLTAGVFDGQVSVDYLWHLVNFTFSNSTPVLGVIKADGGAAVKALFGGALPPMVAFFGGIHNLLSTIFLFFALLAIRNYFKLG